MNARKILLLGMFMMAIAVALGAFGAHGWKAMLAASGRTETYELALRYMMFHALAMILMGTQMEKWPGLRTSGILFAVGVIFFSGSLLILALANAPRWGAVAPVGGTSLILGWLSAFWTVLRSKA
jgi:uncharacterized membrane protein YgdD (TMEM256/DUF423 family)